MMRKLIALALVCAAVTASALSVAPPPPSQRTYQSFVPTGEASLSVSGTTGNVALGSSAAVAWVCNSGATNAAYVVLGTANTVTATVAGGFPVLPGQCVSLDATGYSYLAAITASSTTTLLISTGSGHP